MKDKIHPQYFPKAKIACACGNVLTVGSTAEEVRVDICSKCHPFYTGKQKFIDKAGRVEKFQERMKRAASTKQPSAKRSAKKTA